MHEATRRILSVILQRVEGFQGRGNNVLIGATNRKEDLDAALISRFDTSIRYQLPDYDTRRDVLKRLVHSCLQMRNKLLYTIMEYCAAFLCRVQIRQTPQQNVSARIVH